MMPLFYFSLESMVVFIYSSCVMESERQIESQQFGNPPNSLFLLQIDKSLPFLDRYVQQAIEKGAQPYIPESERSGMFSVASFGNQDMHDASSHGLRFEAYELPKPSVPSKSPPVSLAPSSELVPVPELSYTRESHHTAPVYSAQDTRSAELRLRLDGVQKKWGRPNYSSPATTSEPPSQKTTNGVSQVDAPATTKSKAPETSYDSRRQQAEIPPEKQKLAASLFGASSRTERKSTSTSNRGARPSNQAVEKSQASKQAVASNTEEKTTPLQPPPDLLDLGEPTIVDNNPVDPLKQLEGLLDSTQDSSSLNNATAAATKTPDIMSLYTGTSASGQSSSKTADINLISGLSDMSIKSATEGITVANQTNASKGPNLKDALEKDAKVRQVGVTPTTQNPNLFKDLLG